ncbi:hypothetical protein ACCO45_002645 [Purpureocillium lilacinum]|uniref:Uncharacterized protein n=1 Tax=Purpureocillium lilacinum TaxID=33203 RepID=A0ACC4EAH1_PURLI
MAPPRTHLSLLQDRARTNGSLRALHVAEQGPDSRVWKEVTYSQLLSDVEMAARFWAQEFASKGLQAGSTIGVWLKGFSYLDLIHLWGISRAGYVPQPISLRMADPKILLDLFARSEAVGLVVDPSCASSIANSGLITFVASDIFQLDTDNLPLPEWCPPSGPDDIIMLFHTSGSTSGKPKLVPATAGWLDASVKKAMDFLTKPTHGLRSQRQAAVVAAEARQDESLLACLKDFEHVVYSGLPLDTKDELWALEQGISIVNVFASTEVGIMLRSTAPNGMHTVPPLEPFPGTAYEFRPVADGLSADGSLFELVVTAKSADCPHPSLRDRSTGDFYTGDLFTRCKPRGHLAAGRMDDWIKLESAFRCDTRSLEQKVMETCGDDLVGLAVVIGTGRPLPALVVEPREESKLPAEDLKTELLNRISQFQAQRYIHERVVSPKRVLVVPRNGVPRVMTAKGTLRRQDVEMAFKDALDRIDIPANEDS